MKINSILNIGLSILLFSSCQKGLDVQDEAPQTGNGDTQKTAPAEVKIKSVCSTKEVIKLIEKKDGSIRREKNEMVYRNNAIIKYLVAVGQTKKSESTGDSYMESYTTKDGEDKKLNRKIDYTYNSTTESKKTTLGNNKFTMVQKTKTTRAGRNGYQPPKAETILDLTRTFFDDGSTYYIISEIHNGQVVQDSVDLVSKYETTGNTTTWVTTYRQLPVVKDEDGFVTQETEFYEEICRDEVQSKSLPTSMNF